MKPIFAASFIFTAAIIPASLIASPAFAAKTDFTMGMVLEPPHLDPTAGAPAAIDEIVYANLFEGLTRVNAMGEVKPALASSWTIAEDGKTYTFKLQQGVTFHDGAAFTAEDVKFSIDRAMADDSTNAQKTLFKGITAVNVIDDATVEIVLENPVGALLYNLGWGDAVIVDAASAETNKEAPVGTGPFKLSNWAKGSQLILDAYDSYWGDKPALQKVTFKFISDPNAATSALLSGDVDGFANFPAPEAVPQFQADPRFAVVIGVTEGETILSTNNTKPPFDNIKVRQAMAMAIDRQAIIDGAMFGQGTPIGSHFPPGNAAYLDLTGANAFDPDKAKALLAEAGFPDGFSATLKLPPPSYARRGGEIIASQLRNIGINLEIIPVEWAQWVEQVFTNKDYDLTIVSHTEPNDIEIYARDNYYFNYNKPEFKALITELNATAAPEARTALLQQAQQMLSDDAVNTYLFQLAKVGIWDARVQGLWANSPVQANDMTGVNWSD